MKVRRWFIVSILIIAVLFVNVAEASAASYTTDYYGTEIKVDEQNQYHITESIQVDFKTNKHGIYRYIPAMGKTLLEGDEPFSFLMDITDVSVSGYRYSTYKENGNKVIKVGSEYETVMGEQRYQLEYTLKIGSDSAKGYDFVYCNAIPNDWETDIENAYVALTLPKGFDADDVQVIVGYKNSLVQGKVNYWVEDNTVYVESTERLSQGVGISIYVRLPEGYFSSAGKTFQEYYDIGLYIFAGVVGIIVVLLFFRFGRDKKIIAPVEFTAPGGIDSAAAGYIVDGVADKKDIVSLIIYWADKGYLQIQDRGKNDMLLVKLAELPATAAQYEYVLFNDLFAYTPQVSLKSLENKMYKAVNRAKAILETRLKASVFDETSLKMRWISYISLALLAVAFGLRWTLVLYQDWMTTAILTLLPMAVFFGGFCILLNVSRIRTIRTKLWVIVHCVLSYLLFGIAIGLTVYFSNGRGYDPYFVHIGILLICAALAPLAINTVKWTDYGYDMVCRLSGFKNFIATAEKARIEKLVYEDPSYFYHVLPYAYVFGITNAWAKRFEGIAIEPPNWYVGYSYGHSNFSTILFISHFNRSMNKMHSTFISTPSSSGSSVGGGGGSFGGGSGGGFGGGGGGSW